ncbi:MipA/OmpV family protein [Neptunicella marina]|uniref:MipA/OmpV family protein n=1 Tax=Neptunicella marina TaxID=2125989 RepID=A0A8J6IPV2_9ALTE|nr:MipA/OmpV family protein [Neptunicella marina]MBC3765625.1 MipA/OmpV family protein [Neptunicella marina]
MFISKPKLILSLACLFCSQLSVAEEWHMQVGGGVLNATRPYTQMDDITSFVPYFSAQYGNWNFGAGNGVVSYNFNQMPFDLSVGIGYRDETYDSDEIYQTDLSDAAVFTGYEDGEGDVVANITLGWNHFSFTAEQDISDHSGGLTLDASYMPVLYRGDKGAQFAIGAGIKWQNSNYTDYLYGIHGDNIAAQYGRNEYSAGSATNPYLAARFIYPVSKQLNLIAMAKLESLDDSIENSPLVDDNKSRSVALLLSYNWF